MRIIDEITNAEITAEAADLTIGELYPALWASPSAYASIDYETKFALADDDYEEVQMYHVWTQEEVSQRAQHEADADLQEEIDALPDAVAELSEMVSNNAVDVSDLTDAIADLSAIVSNLVEGA